MWVYVQIKELRYCREYGDEKTSINQLMPWGLENNFVEVFCGFPSWLDVGKGRKLPYAVQND